MVLRAIRLAEIRPIFGCFVYSVVLYICFVLYAVQVEIRFIAADKLCFEVDLARFYKFDEIFTFGVVVFVQFK